MKKDEIQISCDFMMQADSAGRKNWVEQVVNNKAYFNNVQIEEETAQALEAEQLPIVPTNKVRPAIELLISMLAANPPRFNALPFESSDNKYATHVSHFLEYLWNLSKGWKLIDRAIKDLEISGMMIFQCYPDLDADYEKGEVKFICVDPEDVYIDPDSKDIDCQDAAWLIVSKLIHEDKAKVMFEGVDLEALPADYNDYTDHTMRATENQVLTVRKPDGKYYRLMDRYERVKVQRYHVYDTQTGYEKVFDEKSFKEYLTKPAVILTMQGKNSGYVYDDYQLSNFQDIAKQYGTVYHYMEDPMTRQQIIVGGVESGMAGEIPNTTTMMQFTNIGELVNQGVIEYRKVKVDRIKRVYSIGRHIIYNEVTPMSDYPFAITMLGDNRNPYPVSDMTLVKPLQDQLNVITHLIIKYNRSISTIMAFVPEGTNMQKLAANANRPGMHFFEFDPSEGVPVMMQLTQMSTALYKMRDDLVADIQSTLGAYAMMDGDTTQSPNTKGGTMLMDEFGQRRIVLKRKRIEQCIDTLAKNMMSMAQYIYKDRKVIRIIKPNRDPIVTVLNDPMQDGEATKILNDISSTKYDIVYVSGSMMPTNLMGQFDMLERAYTMGAIRDPLPMLQLLPLDNLEEILEREDRIRQLEAQLGQMEDEIKKLSGDLQTANRAEVQSRKKVEVTKFSSDLKDVGNKLKAQSLIAANKIKADNQTKAKGSQTKTK